MGRKWGSTPRCRTPATLHLLTGGLQSMNFLNFRVFCAGKKKSRGEPLAGTLGFSLMLRLDFTATESLRTRIRRLCGIK
jgi:hypothetical protein